MQKKVSDILPKTEILAQLAEEASELAQAALKNAERRLKRNTQMLWCAWLRLVLRMKEKRMSELELL